MRCTQSPRRCSKVTVQANLNRPRRGSWEDASDISEHRQILSRGRIEIVSPIVQFLLKPCITDEIIVRLNAEMRNLGQSLMTAAKHEKERCEKTLSGGSVYDAKSLRPYSWQELPTGFARLFDIAGLSTSTPLYKAWRREQNRYWTYQKYGLSARNL